MRLYLFGVIARRWAFWGVLMLLSLWLLAACGDYTATPAISLKVGSSTTTTAATTTTGVTSSSTLPQPTDPTKVTYIDPTQPLANTAAEVGITTVAYDATTTYVTPTPTVYHTPLPPLPTPANTPSPVSSTLKLNFSLSAQAGHSEAVQVLTYSPDGKLLASGSWDNSVKLWDAATGKNLATLTGLELGVTAISFNPTGTILAATDGEEVRIWNTTRYKEILSIESPTPITQDAITAVAISPDGSFLATMYEKGKIVLWNTTTGKQLSSFQPDNQQGGYESGTVSFSADGQTLIRAGRKEIEFQNIVTGNLERRIIETGEITFDSHGKFFTLWTGATDSAEAVKILDTATEKEIVTLNGKFLATPKIASTADGSMLATSSQSAIVDVWNVATGQKIFEITPSKPKSAQGAIVFSPDNQILAVGDGDGGIELWNVKTQQKITTLAANNSVSSSLAISPNGKYIAVGSEGGDIKLLDAATGSQIALLKGHTARVDSLAFSPDSKFLVSGSGDYPYIAVSSLPDTSVRLWEIPSGRLIAQAQTPDTVKDIAFSADGKTIIGDIGEVPSFIDRVETWSSSDLKLIQTFSIKPTAIDKLSGEVKLSSDGKFLAIASEGQDDQQFSISVFDTGTGKEVSQKIEPEDTYILAFSPDNKILATASETGFITLRDVATGAYILSLEKHPTSVVALAFSSDGTILATADWDNTIDLWDIKARKLISETKLPEVEGQMFIALTNANGYLVGAYPDAKINIWKIGKN